MPNIKVTKSKDILNKQEFADIQQPISKDGWTNPLFDKLYGKEKNPWTGTERDRKNRKGTRMVGNFQVADFIVEKVIKEYHQTKSKKRKKEIKKWLEKWTNIRL